MDPAKIQTIQDWPEPRNVDDIQKFLGFANFYHFFIDNYSDIVIPLTRATNGILLINVETPLTLSKLLFFWH